MSKYAASLACLLMAGVLGFSTVGRAQEHAAAGHGVGPGPAVLPYMPDGLYMTTGARSLMIPFLLVEKGQWFDPYEWVQRHGMDALNAQFLRGQKLERFHVRTWQASFSSMTLQSMSPQQMLAHDRMKSHAKFDINSLAPSIGDQRCSFESKEDSWRCSTTAVVTKVRPAMQSCSTSNTSMNCGAGVIVPATAYQILTRKGFDPGLLKIDNAATGSQIDAEFKRVAPEIMRNRVGAARYQLDAFYGPERRRLISGFINLSFRVNARKARDNGGPEPASSIQLGFIWDMDRARFLYLQEKPRVLSGSLMRACGQLKLTACPSVSPLGMWTIDDKLYVVWQYSQATGFRGHIRPPSAGAYQYEPKDELSSPAVSQLAVMEIQIAERIAKELFVTKPFLSY